MHLCSIPQSDRQERFTIELMSRVKYETRVPLLWLLGIDLLTWLAFTISVIVLCAGVSPGNLQNVAILSVSSRKPPDVQIDSMADNDTA